MIQYLAWLLEKIFNYFSVRVQLLLCKDCYDVVLACTLRIWTRTAAANLTSLRWRRNAASSRDEPTKSHNIRHSRWEIKARVYPRSPVIWIHRDDTIACSNFHILFESNNAHCDALPWKSYGTPPLLPHDQVAVQPATCARILSHSWSIIHQRLRYPARSANRSW